MSENDFAILFAVHAEAVITILFGFVSITSGFLAAAYLVARTIPKMLAAVLVGLYSVAGLALIGYCERHAQLLMAIRDQLKDIGANWHTAVIENQLINPVLSYTLIVSMLTIYIASVWFFFYARNTEPIERNKRN